MNRRSTVRGKWKGIRCTILAFSSEKKHRGAETLYRQNRASGDRSIDSLGVAGYYVKNSCSFDSLSPREGSDPQRTLPSRSFSHLFLFSLSFFRLSAINNPHLSLTSSLPTIIPAPVLLPWILSLFASFSILSIFSCFAKVSPCTIHSIFRLLLVSPSSFGGTLAFRLHLASSLCFSDTVSRFFYFRPARPSNPGEVTPDPGDPREIFL